MPDMEPEIRERLTRLEQSQTYHYEDIRSLKEENKMTIKILADLQTSVELLRNKLTNVDSRHTADTERTEHTVERYIGLGFQILGSVAAALVIYAVINYGGQT